MLLVNDVATLAERGILRLTLIIHTPDYIVHIRLYTSA